MILSIAVILFTVISACEKDDICPPGSGTTPLLVVGFYDIQDQETEKSVVRLRVVGEGQDDPVNTFTDRSSVSEISLPLKSFENSTTFAVISDSADDDNGVETGNIDSIRFDYNVQEKYISRGCGYSVTYTLQEVTLNPGGSDDDEWIVSYELPVRDITPLDTIHVKIYH
ncbi:hypothetical protein DMZ48_10225 [Robertkochia solimangrovi]|nr:hypothetical protein DMZ48_10225 [Robertkochia solimangrovi]